MPIRLFSLLIFVVLFSYSLNNHAQSINKLNFVTEIYPPYNFVDQGKLKGKSVDLLLDVANVLDLPLSVKNIKVLPWARAYKMAETGPNVVLFSTTRTKKREEKFQWAGPITSTRVVLLAKKNLGINIQTEADVKKYRIGVIRDDIGDQLIQDMEVEDNNVFRNSKADRLARMLSGGRIQLWAYEENVARWSIEKAGLNNNDFEVVYVLNESELFFTFSKDVPKKIVDQFQLAIDKVKKDSDVLYK